MRSVTTPPPQDGPVPVTEVEYDQLRVAVVSDAIMGRNGVGTYYEDLAEHLATRVDRISIVAPRSNDAAGCAAHDIEWFALPMPGDVTQRLAFPRCGALSRVLRELDPHVVVLPTMGPYTVFGARAACRLGIRICTSHHTNFERLVDLYWPWVCASLARKVLRKLSGWVIRKAELVTAMNYESLEDAWRWGAPRTRMVGTPLAKCFLDTPHVAMRTPPRRVAYIGRLSAEKRIDQVLAAAKALPNFEFTIAGDGPLRTDVEDAAHRLANVHFRGWVPRAGVLDLLDRSDVLVLPSALETFGTVALEALARKRCVIVSRDCGISDWPDLAQGLFTMDEHEALSGTLLRLSNMSPVDRTRIAARSWEAVRQFNDESVGRWLNVLCEVANGVPASSVQSQLASPQVRS